MPKPSNSEIERYYFDQFLKFYSLPEGKLVHGDKPDVIIHGTKKIGVEITNFFLESGKITKSEQRQKPMREGLIEEASRVYLANGGTPVVLTFGFDINHPIQPKEINKLAKILAEVAQLSDGKPNGTIYRHLFQHLAPQVKSIYRYAGSFGDSKWRIAQCYSVPLTCKDDIEAIVRKKEFSATEYETCDAYWLLIVVDGINAAQDQEIRIDNLNIRSDTFEKVILFHTFGRIKEAAITSSII